MKSALKMPIVVGIMLGLMLPWMIHGNGTAGVLFIASHVIIVAAVAALTLFGPSLRRKLPNLLNHRPKMTHLLPAGAAFAAGWAITCEICLTIGGQHWT